MHLWLSGLFLFCHNLHVYLRICGCMNIIVIAWSMVSLDHCFSVTTNMYHKFAVLTWTSCQIIMAISQKFYVIVHDHCIGHFVPLFFLLSIINVFCLCDYCILWSYPLFLLIVTLWSNFIASICKYHLLYVLHIIVIATL